MDNRKSFDTKFRQVVREYLVHLTNGGDRYIIGREQRPVSEKMYVSASSLMDCPLRAAKEKLKEQAIIEGLLKENSPTLLLRMQQGTMVAEIFQEAFLWWNKFKRDDLRTVFIERTLESQELHFRGRMDMECYFDMLEIGKSKTHIVEFKHRLPTYKDKFPQPRMSDVFQLLAYKVLRGSTKELDVPGHLCIINTPQYAEFQDEYKGFELWELSRLSLDSFQGYALFNEEGQLWNHPMNTPQYINIMALEQEIERQMMYLEGVRETPIQLGDDEAWQCRKVIAKPSGGKSGRFKPMCAHYCHDDGQASVEYGYTVNNDGSWSVVW